MCKNQIIKVINCNNCEFVAISKDIVKDVFFAGNTKKIINYFKPTNCITTTDYQEKMKPLIIIGEKSLGDIAKIDNLDRYFKFIDCCIWIRYVQKPNICANYNCLCIKAKTENCQFYRAVKEIERNNTLGLYSTNNALEIIEFKARQAQNSYLSDVGGHNKNVVPFLFHSETEMQDEAKLQLEILNEKKNLQWRFLLIDDHASKQAAEEAVNYQIKNDKPNIIPKCKIIRNILAPHFQLHCCQSNNDCNEFCKSKEENNTSNKLIAIYLDCVTTIKDVEKDNIIKEGAISKIGKTKYDLILMDYLLDSNINGKRNYAHNLLKAIEDKCINREWEIRTNRIGPNGKLQIFYISAFTNAVKDRMLEQGLNYHSDYWHISHGACPTTTPHLFLYYLLRRMNSQIKGFTELSPKDKIDIITLLDLLLEIYRKEMETRKQAIKFFNSLLKLRYNYDNLKYDVCDADEKCKKELPEKDASKLVKILFPDIPFYDNAFWEHVQHLVYLTAYGTIHQWPDMWEEFCFVKHNLIKAENKLFEKLKVTPLIEGYVISLKNKSES